LNFEIVENVVSSEEKSALGPSSTTVDVGSSNTGISQPGSSGIGSGNGNSASQPPAPSGFGSSSSAANRTAKIRRLMVAARRPGAICGRTGVIVDRTRATLPASSIPEELIAQAQVVLQGKSREVIVRELQRTNLNVNEAVNNLLSRDDDEGTTKIYYKLIRI
jgi:E3 ubiquitin-protein ligase EDD1